MKRFIRLFLSIVVGGVLINVMYQNCSAPKHSSTKTVDLPSDHPSIDPLNYEKPASAQIQMADRVYLESFLRDVFLSENSSQDEINFTEAVFDAEFNPSQHILGRPCNPYVDGSLVTCYGVESNQLNAFEASSSSAREGSKYQVCRRLLENGTMLAAVIKKLPPRTSTPDEESIDAAIALFYPNLEDKTAIRSSLQKIDEAATQNRETVPDRWRLVLLSLCESTAWSIL